MSDQDIRKKQFWRCGENKAKIKYVYISRINENTGHWHFSEYYPNPRGYEWIFGIRDPYYLFSCIGIEDVCIKPRGKGEYSLFQNFLNERRG